MRAVGAALAARSRASRSLVSPLDLKAKPRPFLVEEVAAAPVTKTRPPSPSHPWCLANNGPAWRACARARQGTHLALQQLAQKTLGGLLVAPALDENAEHDPIRRPDRECARASAGCR